MEEALKGFIGKLIRLYTISGIESYLGTLEEVKPTYLVMRSAYSKDLMYVAMNAVECFKEVTEK